MEGIIIKYEYNGDEAAWNSAVNDFLGAINNDSKLKGKFNYMVFKAKEGGFRTHVGRWDSEETLSHLQSQDFFKQFSGKIKEMAGESLSPQRVTLEHFS